MLLARPILKVTMGESRMRYWHVEDQMFTVGDGREVPRALALLAALVAGMGWMVLGLALLVPTGAVGSTVGPGRIAGIALLTPTVGCLGIMAVWFGRALMWRWRTRNAEVFSPHVYAFTEWLGLVIGLAAGLALGIRWTT